MNLRQLEIFIAVADTASFSRGAERISLNQSTVSQHIATLENEIDMCLFDRTGKGALLTSNGHIYLKHARRILAERDTLFESMAGLQALDNALLTIGASNIPANYLIPPVLPSLAEQYPGISLTMQTGDSLDIFNRLLSAEVELAVVGNCSRHKSVDCEPLYKDLLVLIVGPEHPWHQQGKVSIDELAEGSFVVRESGSGSGQALDTSLSSIGFDPSRLKIAARLGSNEAVQQAVAVGFGCAFVSELSIGTREKNREVFRVEVDGLTVERKLWLAKLRTRSTSAAAQAFSALLLKYYAL